MPLAITSPISLALIAITHPLGELRHRAHARLRRGAAQHAPDYRLASFTRVREALVVCRGRSDVAARIVMPYLDMALPACGLPVEHASVREESLALLRKVEHHLVAETPNMQGVTKENSMRWAALEAIAADVVSRLSAVPRKTRELGGMKAPSVPDSEST